MVQEYDSEGDRIAHIRILISVIEQQIEADFTHNEPMKARVRQYKRWLREMERAA